MFLKVTFQKTHLLYWCRTREVYVLLDVWVVHFNFTLCVWWSLFINHVFYWCKLQKVVVSLYVFVKSSNFTRCFWRSLFKKHVFFQPQDAAGPSGTSPARSSGIPESNMCWFRTIQKIWFWNSWITYFLIQNYIEIWVWNSWTKYLLIQNYIKNKILQFLNQILFDS